ncbi:MAG: thioredoxin family protein, partial [Planctomycetota bacterium]
MGPRQPEAVKDQWFQNAVLKNSRPVVVKFGAEWCGPCRSLDEALRQVKSKHPGAAFLTIDIDKRPELFAHYGSGRCIPQIMIFDQGRLIATQSGFRGIDRLEAWLHQ